MYNLLYFTYESNKLFLFILFKSLIHVLISNIFFILSISIIFKYYLSFSQIIKSILLFIFLLYFLSIQFYNSLIYNFESLIFKIFIIVVFIIRVIRKSFSIYIHNYFLKNSFKYLK